MGLGLSGCGQLIPRPDSLAFASLSSQMILSFTTVGSGVEAVGGLVAYNGRSGTAYQA